MDRTKDVLDAEYMAGRWDYLRSLNELARFSVVVGYCHYLKEAGSILEIGCGEGILQERLHRAKYSHYVGLDVSAEAIHRATHKQDEKNCFVRADATTYEPDQRFDVIVFNECLEYFDDPLNLVRRYERFLEHGGIFLVSMFVGKDTVRTKRIWKMLETVYTPEIGTQVTNTSGHSWMIKVFNPLRSYPCRLDDAQKQ
jgi:2-polyprenyl-3-methyl-5-hydroxy-6-metoxy-1,4-benzoquinol methylase